MRIIVVSATSEIAKCCVKIWATAQETEFVLVGRDQSRLEALSNEFATRFPASKFLFSVADFTQPEDIEKALSVAVAPVDLILLAQGSATNQKTVKSDLHYLKSELLLNAVSVAMFAEASARLLEKQNKGALAIIGSVAGDRGRAYNYSYGAAKSLVETTAEGLQQRLAGSTVSVSLIKPGPTQTPMTKGHKGVFTSPEKVAKVIVEGVSKGKRIIYAPKRWRVIMFVVRNLPFTLFKRFRF